MAPCLICSPQQILANGQCVPYRTAPWRLAAGGGSWRREEGRGLKVNMSHSENRADGGGEYFPLSFCEAWVILKADAPQVTHLLLPESPDSVPMGTQQSSSLAVFYGFLSPLS